MILLDCEQSCTCKCQKKREHPSGSFLLIYCPSLILPGRPWLSSVSQISSYYNLRKDTCRQSRTLFLFHCQYFLVSQQENPREIPWKCFALAQQQSYYKLWSICAGESQGGNPIGKALVIYNSGSVNRPVPLQQGGSSDISGTEPALPDEKGLFGGLHDFWGTRLI